MQKRVQSIRQDLEERGWERNVNVQGSRAKTSALHSDARGHGFGGVAVTVVDPKNGFSSTWWATSGPKQIAALGEKLYIKPLKKSATPSRSERQPLAGGNGLNRAARLVNPDHRYYMNPPPAPLVPPLIRPRAKRFWLWAVLAVTLIPFVVLACWRRA